uniref:Putative c2h2-type zn-finger protein n=1 Tax=Triatoma infestans TaxID=30076 RepID=A0A023F113_TRIIF
MRIKMPAVRIAQADVELQQPSDVLTCGACQKPFALGEIVKFIQHKVLACNKENYSCEPSGTNNSLDSGDSDDGGGGGGNVLGVVGTRRPSISAPIKKVLPPSGTAGSGGGRISCTPSPPDEEPRCSTPKRRPRPSTPVHMSEEDIKAHRIKLESDSTPPHSSPDEGTCKKLRTDVSDAQSNTTNTEPSNYVCSTCKARLHSAWRLVQHVQNSHGIKIYVESSPTSSTSSLGSSPGTSSNAGKNQSTSSNCSSSSSGCLSSGGVIGVGGAVGGMVSGGGSSNSNSTAGGQSTPLSLGAPPRLGGIPTSSPLVEPHLPLHNPFTVGGLLRMPLEPPRHHQFAPSSLGPAASSLFARPSSHNEHQFRMDQLVSEQFRLGHHHTLAAAVAAVSACPPQHTPFGPPPSERPSPILPPTTVSRTVVPPALPPPSLALPLEPQIDFYSQRLRQLAGTTSPGATNGNSSSPSPRKLTSPFTSPNNNNLQPPPVSLAPPLMLNNNNNSTTSNNNNNNSSKNNNNNNSTNNNNINTRSPTPRPQSSTPPTEPKPTQITETSPRETSLDMTTTPRSAPSPSSKPTDFSRTATENLENSDNNKLHSCNYCGKKFRFQSNLIVHRRCHTGEKPYKCSVCNHACSQSSKLKRHMKVHKRSRSKISGAGGEDGANPNGSAPTNSTVDQLSNEGSIGTSDEDDDDDMDEDEDEEEDEDDDEEMELEEEEEGDEDDDLGGDAPEDLTTKSTSSTPPATSESKGGGSGGGSGGGGGGVGTGSSPQPPGVEKSGTNAGSLVGELMDKFGLNNIQQYSEAYKQALQESVGAQHLISRKDDLLHRTHLLSDNNNCGSKPSAPTSRLENGLLEKSAAALRFRDEFAKNIITGQPPLDLVGGHHGLFGAPFENPFDGKRLKMESRDSLGRGGSDRNDNMFAGMWLPAMAAAHHRDQMFGTNGSDGDILKDKTKNSANPGTSASLAAAAAAAAALNLGLPSQAMKKENRRNDTCEYCGKVFKNCSNLTVHRRSHTGEKPYKCELCSYACAQSSKLTRHMKTHGRMGKDVYRCRFCEMPFSVPSTLEKHMRKCVVNQNIKVEHLLPSMLSGDEDSVASTPKDTTSST